MPIMFAGCCCGPCQCEVRSVDAGCYLATGTLCGPCDASVTVIGGDLVEHTIDATPPGEQLDDPPQLACGRLAIFVNESLITACGDRPMRLTSMTIEYGCIGATQQETTEGRLLYVDMPSAGCSESSALFVDVHLRYDEIEIDIDEHPKTCNNCWVNGLWQPEYYLFRATSLPAVLAPDVGSTACRQALSGMGILTLVQTAIMEALSLVPRQAAAGGSVFNDCGIDTHYPYPPFGGDLDRTVWGPLVTHEIEDDVGGIHFIDARGYWNAIMLAPWHLVGSTFWVQPQWQMTAGVVWRIDKVGPGQNDMFFDWDHGLGDGVPGCVASHYVDQFIGSDEAPEQSIGTLSMPFVAWCDAIDDVWLGPRLVVVEDPPASAGFEVI